MDVPNNFTNINCFCFQEFHQNQNIEDSSKDKLNLSSDSENDRIHQFKAELENNEKKLKLNSFKSQKQNNNLFHFNFNADLIDHKKPSYSEKNLNFSEYNNISFVEKRNDNSMHYVGFENKYGENSCYINVILHFLYIFPSVNEFLIKFYKNKLDIFNNSINNDNSIKNNIDCFLFTLGKTLFEYQKILSNSNSKGITILNTNELRQYLQLISNNYFTLNKVGDPVELLTSLLNEINNYNKLEIHNDFFINLIEEKKCNFCINKSNIKKYDENNFIHYISVNEIIRNIKGENINFAAYSHQLFKYSKLYSSKSDLKCEHCGSNLKNQIKYINEKFPTFFLLNCIWNKRKPDLDDVLKFYYLLSLEDNITNLFHCEIKNKEIALYNLLGMILYSPVLSHYINVLFNFEKNVFVIYDDDKIKEIPSIHDVYKEVTLEQIKANPEVFYYPVLLIYYKEIIYNDKKTIKLNNYSNHHYIKLEEECLKAKNSHISLTKEQKLLNYIELVKAQKNLEKNRRYSMEPINNSFSMFIEDEYSKEERKIFTDVNDNKLINSEKKNKENNDMILEENDKTTQKENTEKKRSNKRFGTQTINHRYYHFQNFDFFQNIL